MIRELRGDGLSHQAPESNPNDSDDDSPASGGQDRRPYQEYAFITAGYLSLYGIFLALAGRQDALKRPVTSMDLTLLALATVRLSRLTAWEKVTSFLRLPLVEHGPDDPITGPEQKPRGRGFLRAFGELILCTTCVGTWIAALLTYGMYIAPGMTRPFLAIMAAAGLSQAADAALALTYAARDRLQDQERPG